MSSYNNIQEIILRYLNGEATSEEEDQLQRWVKESAANKEELETITILWRDSSAAGLHSFNVERAWEKVHSRTVGKESKIRHLFAWKKAVAIAASIILIASSFYFYNRSSKITWTDTVATTSNKTIALTDGSTITLRKGSTLSMPDNFGNASRNIRLKGEAYFEIRHDDQNPFSITTQKSFIQDIGTSFLVRSYDTLEQVTVMEGSVLFENKDKKGESIQLKGGESVILENGQPFKKNIENSNLLSWKTNTLVFVNKPLQLVAEDLRNYYAVDVYFPAELGSVPVTANFKNQSLEEVVNELHLFTNLRIQLKDHDLYISK